MTQVYEENAQADDIFDYPLDPNPTPDVTLGHNR